MKILLTTLFSFIFVTLSFGEDVQDTTSQKADSVKLWKFDNILFLTFNQIAFSNWATGGETSISGKVSDNFKVSYNKKKFTFFFESNFAFGIVGYFEKKMEKTDDNINLLTSFSSTINSKWSTTALVTFKSQFAKGYKYPDDSTLISEFMAPGYLTISFGTNYKPSKFFQLFLSPISGKFTFVLNQELADKGLYGVTGAIYDTIGNIITPGKNMLGELGFNFVTSINYKLMDNISINSILNLHNNYIDPVKTQRWIFDIDWNTRIVFKINKLFATIFYLDLKYDRNAKFPIYETNEDGEEIIVDEKAKLQLKESLGISITFKI
jgi:hypothetical protein